MALTDHLIIVGFGLAFAAAVGASVANATHVEHRTCTVSEKDRTTVSDGNGGSKSDARVYTENCGVLHVEDSLLSWTFSSSDTYASMKPDHTYRVTTRGYRIPFLSMFPNVVDAAEVPR
jgi:hypothetical protein